MLRLEHTLVFIRHGETDWNAEQRLQGQRDIPLNPRGRGQARRNGEVLAKAVAGAAGFDFVSSPLKRARETMEILRGAMGLDPGGYRIDPQLVEITFGDWEGFTLDELALQDAAAVERRQRDKWGYMPPGGESYAMLAERVEGWIASLRADTVAVSHGAVGRVLRGHLLGIGDAEVPVLPAPQDSFLVYRAGEAVWH
jgi:probable phosphoglycerate mutase